MKKKYRILLFVFLPMLLIDQLSKYIIERTFTLHNSKEVISGFFSLTYVLNKGAAFGLFANVPAAPHIFTIVSLLAILFIIVFFRTLADEEVFVPISLSLVLTGAVGNLIDRFRVGGVVDFLDFYYKGWHWPAFNVADAAITIGVILLALKVTTTKKVKTQRG